MVPVTPTADTPKRARIDSVQFMRGIAALLVVAHHTSLIMAHPEYGSLDAFGAITGMGWSGVNFFFVLSGFIIMYAHESDIGQPRRLGHYAWRRFSRVYPVYWVFLTAFVVAALAGFGKREFALNTANLVTAYSLLQFAPSPSLPLKVAWTLFYEIGFYIAFAVLILNRRLGIAFFAGWLAWILINAFVNGNIAMGLDAIWSVHFFFGIAAFYLTRSLPTVFGLPICLAGLVGIVALGVSGWIPGVAGDAQVHPWINIVIGLPYTAILVGGVLLERHFQRSIPASLALLGNASYSLYLVHSAFISFACIVNHRFTLGVLPPKIMFFVIAGMAVIAGITVHLFIERPLLEITRSVFGRQSIASESSARPLNPVPEHPVAEHSAQ